MTGKLLRCPILTRRRVDGHTAVEVGLGGAHLHRDTEALQHLVAGHANQVHAHHLLVVAVADEHHSHGGGGVRGEAEAKEWSPQVTYPMVQ